jgi:hypothetical protein
MKYWRVITILLFFECFKICKIVKITGYYFGITLWTPDQVSVVNTGTREITPLYEIPE